MGIYLDRDFTVYQVSLYSAGYMSGHRTSRLPAKRIQNNYTYLKCLDIRLHEIPALVSFTLGNCFRLRCGTTVKRELDRFKSQTECVYARQENQMYYLPSLDVVSAQFIWHDGTQLERVPEPCISDSGPPACVSERES